MIVRPAVPQDAPAIAEIYAPFVAGTAVSFEETPPTAVEMLRRIEHAQSRWQWLVADLDGTVAGYAYGTRHRERAAYRWSVEVSAYVHPDHHRQGIGRALYRQLLDDLAGKGFCNAYAGIALPNDSSVALHRAAGFEPIGVFKAVGW